LTPILEFFKKYNVSHEFELAIRFFETIVKFLIALRVKAQVFFDFFRVPMRGFEDSEMVL